ncbi:hypothetical protein GCM10009596_21380 [Arthrobacter rhombi]
MQLLGRDEVIQPAHGGLDGQALFGDALFPPAFGFDGLRHGVAALLVVRSRTVRTDGVPAGLARDGWTIQLISAGWWN